MAGATGSGPSVEVGYAMYRDCTDAFFIIDAKTNRLLDVNSTAQRLTGFDRGDLVGMQVTDLLSAESDGVHQVVGAVQRTGFFHSREGYYLRRREGPPLPVNVSVSRLQTLPEPRGLVMVRDISERLRVEEERRQLESRLRHAQKLESLVRMAGGVAHDFNNLLTVILGDVSLALEQMDESHPARVPLTDAVAITQRAGDLCQQILAFTGKSTYAIQPIGLSSLIKHMEPLLRSVVGKEAELRYELTEELPVLNGCPNQIRQVVLNLVTNAFEALRGHAGSITLATGLVTADRAYLAETHLDENLPEGDYIYLEVTDTGAGMEPEVQTKIFDPFFSTKQMGRGLGLAAVLGIVRGHRGAIKLVSHAGTGTTFLVLLPLAGRAVSLPLPPPRAAAPRKEGPQTILVIDDEDGVRRVAKAVLESAGYRVLTAADGSQGVAVFKLHQEEIDAVLLDLSMPVMNGEETLHALRQLAPGICVLLTSGYNEQEVVQRFAGKGLAGFLAKPFGPRDLLARMGEVLTAP